jgi:hypothetical protein
VKPEFTDPHRTTAAPPAITSAALSLDGENHVHQSPFDH